jgi:hypothetical protein
MSLAHGPLRRGPIRLDCGIVSGAHLLVWLGGFGWAFPPEPIVVSSSGDSDCCSALRPYRAGSGRRLPRALSPRSHASGEAPGAVFVELPVRADEVA